MGGPVSAIESDVSWFVSGTSYAPDQEYIMASLALIHYATSTFSESSLKELMFKLVGISPDFTGRLEDFIPPLTWTSTDQATVHQIKEFLVQSIVGDAKGTTAPVIHVGMNSYSIYTTANALYKWRRSLCAGMNDKNPKPLLAPSWDKNKKLRFTLMLPQLARRILTEFGTMHVQLQVAVDAIPMAAVTGPPPLSPC